MESSGNGFDKLLQKVQLLADQSLADFWDFATTIRRTKSLAEKESQRLRGVWLTKDFVVQHIHGWGLHSVRIVCVRANDQEHRRHLIDFFIRDRRNIEARLSRAADPLDSEQRVLVKIPYDASLDGWVEHEWQVLHELDGIPGVPRLAGGPLFFEDVGVRALVLEYSAMPDLQSYAEVGQQPPIEELHHMAAFVLKTLEQVHQRGWIHGDLQPKDLLISPASQSWRQPGEALPAGLVCGWTHAARWRSGEADRAPAERAALLSKLPFLLEAATTQRANEAGHEESSASRDRAFRSRLSDLAGPSAFSAPEQYITLYTGQVAETPSTDVYRVAAIALQTFGARPFSGEGGTSDSVTMLRRLCHCALLRRARGEVVEEGPSSGGSRSAGLRLEEEVELFTSALRQLLEGEIDVSALDCREVEVWLQSCLVKDPARRPESAEAALEALDASWSEVEARMLADRQPSKGMTAKDKAARRALMKSSSTKAEQKGHRLVLEMSPELKRMNVL